jgi:hypothetical protein
VSRLTWALETEVSLDEALAAASEETPVDAMLDFWNDLSSAVRDQVLGADHLLTDLDDEGFSGLRLGEIVPQPFGEPRSFPLEVRHSRQHRDRIPTGRVCLGAQQDAVA